MSLLLTKNCHYAILVAIEDGQHFKAQEDKDIYITSRLNLKLPRPVDDLIPPITLISTKPTILTDKPQWRTTLVYYLSSQILHRLRKRQAQITLEVITLPEKGSRDKIGTMVLQMDDAKLVLMRDGKRDISQIQQFVVDKGDWLSINENSRSKVKAGLFIVEMPNNTDTQDKEVGTPLQMPVRTNYLAGKSGELGLEIISDVSEILSTTAGYHYNNGDGNLLLDDDEDEEDFEQNVQLDDEYEEEEEEQQQTDNEQEEAEAEEEDEEEGVIAIGNGLDQYTFHFHIIEAQYISTITAQYLDQKEDDDDLNFPNVYFHYEFADRQFQFMAEYQPDHWKTFAPAHTLLFQGHLDDIKAWLADQGMITICLIMQDGQGKTDIIGFSEVYLKGRDLGITEQASIIYDCERIWHINNDKQFSKVQLQIGLTPGWNDDTNDESVF